MPMYITKQDIIKIIECAANSPYSYDNLIHLILLDMLLDNQSSPS